MPELLYLFVKHKSFCHHPNLLSPGSHARSTSAALWNTNAHFSTGVGNSVMQPHQSCGLLRQLNHPLTREKWTVDKQHQFQRLGRTNVSIMTFPSRAARQRRWISSTSLTDRMTRWWLVISCCSLCWKIATDRNSHWPGAHFEPSGGGKLILMQMLLRHVNSGKLMIGCV